MLRSLFLKLNQNQQILKVQKNRLLQCQLRAAYSTTPAAEDLLLEQTHIDEVVRLNPALAKVAPEIWQRTHETFINHGMYTMNFLRIVSGNPAILTRSPNKIIESIELWRGCQFGEKMLYLLLTKYPELLNVVDGRQLLGRIAYLKSFACTDKNVWKLLMSCPDLLQQSEARIESNLAYLQNEMRIEIPEIVKSEALSKPLEEIRCRHVFLQRLAIFKPRPEKVDPDEPTKNPRLYQITDTSEKAFATKICHVTLAEYEAFKELYARELDRKSRKTDDEDLSEDDN